MIGPAINLPDMQKRRWHRVQAGSWLGTLTWFADGTKRVVKNEQIWRLQYVASTSEGPLPVYCYAYDDEAKATALQHRSLSFEQTQFEKNNSL